MFRIFNRVRPFLDLDAEGFGKEIRDNDDVVVIDVRTLEEFNMGRIPGAIHMDITRGDSKAGWQDLTRRKPI